MCCALVGSGGVMECYLIFLPWLAFYSNSILGEITLTKYVVTKCRSVILKKKSVGQLAHVNISPNVSPYFWLLDHRDIVFDARLILIEPNN